MMWPPRISPTRLFAILALSFAAGGAQAQGLGYGYGPYHGTYGGQAYGYGFAEPAIRGDYIGAPLTRTPRPSDLVPSVWGYGTYGVPTMTGIRSAPVGVPTVYVIDGPPRSVRRPKGHTTSREAKWSRAEMYGQPGQDHAGGARVISVAVPRR